VSYTDWAKANKKRIAREFIRQINYTTSSAPSGIFTAGLPGVGKTEFTVELIKGIEPKPLRIDMDEIARMIEGYKPKIADKFRGGASIIISRIYDEVIKHNINFIFDGTFSSDGAMENLRRALHHNYKVKVYYIHQVPAIAWQFTKDRELVEHRSIEISGFKESYFKLMNNLKYLCENYNDVTISLVIKNERNEVGELIEDVNEKIFELLPAFLTEEQLNAAII
jgi:predicted ABC-type ATPase